MSSTITVGTRLRSAVCSTQVVVIRLDPAAETIACGGVPMVPISATAEAPDGTPLPGYDGGTLLGKRYGDASDPVELLCTKPGAGSLSIGERVLTVRSAKSLPSSD